jgi:spore coat protein CotF
MQDQYTMLRQLVKDPELRDIIDRQYQFIADEYNIMVDCFSTGRDPSHPTGSYKMKQSNDVIYGLKPSQPKKPIQSPSEFSDQHAVNQMISLCKGAAQLKTLAACEATNPVVRRVIADSIQNCIEMAYELFLYANKKGYYQVPQYSQKDMQQIISSFAPAQTTGAVTTGSMPAGVRPHMQ